MQHLKHVLAVVVPLVIAAASTIAVSPAAQNFASDHAALTAYILLAAGVLRAVYKALTSEQPAAGETDPTKGPGSNSMNAR